MSTSESELFTDVLIVGGGPAGSLLGSLLARKGIDVTVIEKQATSERNFRGETISASSVRSLFQLGYGPALQAHGFLAQTGIVMRKDGARILGIDYRRMGDGYLPIDIPRPALIDVLLADAACHAGFRYLPSTSLKELVVEGGAVVGAVVRGKPGGSVDGLRLRSRLVVGADGRFSKTRQQSGLAATITDMPRDFLWFRLPRPEGWTTDGELIVRCDRNLLILPTFPDQLQVGYNMPKGGFAHLRKAGIEAFRQSVTTLDPRLGPLMSEHVTSFADTSFLEIFTAVVPEWAMDGLLLIGDAAHTPTPILWQGVNLALQDSIGAAHLIGRHLLGSGTSTSVLPADLFGEFVGRRRAHKNRVTRMQSMQERSLASSGRLAMIMRRRGMRLLDRLPLKYRLLSATIDPGVTGWEADLTADPQLTEAKRFVGLHAGHLGVTAELSHTLTGVTRLDGTGRASWATELTALADRPGRPPQQQASLLNLARFPVADDEARQAAGARAAQIVADDLCARGAGERLTARLNGIDVPFLFRSGGPGSPVLMVMGGIVTIKEQWVPFLALSGRVGCSVAVLDFPGTGENPLPYTRNSALLFGAALDTLEGRCRSSSALLLTPSFGGHLGLLAAGADPRIRRVFSIDTPLRQFFTAVAQGAAVPAITLRALAHCCDVTVEDLSAVAPALAFDLDDLARVRVPVDMVVSLRDDVVPSEDWKWARDHGCDLRFHLVDDEHGAPRHQRWIRLLVAAAVLEHAGRSGPQAAVDTLVRLARLTNRLPQPVLSLPDSSHPIPAEGAHR